MNVAQARRGALKKGPNIRGTASENKVVRVAAVQMLVRRDARLNLERILKFIEKAAGKGSHIVCMPEACLVNDYQNVVPIETYLRKIRSKCRERSVWCLLGTYAKMRGRVTNLALLIGRDGAMVHTYAKVNLYRDELRHGVVAGAGTE